MKLRHQISGMVVAAAIVMISAVPAFAGAAKSRQTQGSANAPAQAPSGAAAAGTADASSTASLPMPPEEVIRRFAQHESEFKIARGQYTYSQSVLVEDVAPNQGQYRLDSEVVFTPQGKRYENITYAPQTTLVDFSLSPEDMKDLEDIQPFVLTTEDLPKYKVEFLRREKVDELSTYVFQVGPKTLEKGQRYFQGTVWVDEHDLAVVKSDGKAVPDLKDNKFPRFVTYRENIEANFWFPTYTHADDTLHFSSGDVRIRMTVRYKNYKRFGSTVTLGPAKTIDNPPPDGQQPPKK